MTVPDRPDAQPARNPESESSSEALHTAAAGLSGGGEMGELLRAKDWAHTPIGPVSEWPQSLKSTVKTLLASRYPMVLVWGPELIQFYNDAYSLLIGDKHPEALGIDIRITLAEAWNTLGPMVENVMRTGVANWTPALLLLMERSSYREESYFSVSHAPVEDDQGRIYGMLGVCSEVTQQVLGERRLRLLRDLASRAGEMRSAENTCSDIMAAIAAHPLDVPLALLYLRTPGGTTLKLCGTVGLTSGTPAAPPVIDLAENNADVVWPLGRAASGETVQIDTVDRLVNLPGGPWGEPVHAALAMPIPAVGQSPPLGVLIAGVSPNRALDEGYASFYELLVAQVSVLLRNARAYEEERRRAEALAELDRAKTAFFSNVSHEFRTPLTLLLGPVEDALTSPTATLAGEELQTVHRNSLRLLKLVNTLLDFSRIEAGRLRASYEPTDLAALTAELASVFRSAIERAGLRLLVDCPPLKEPVYVDRDMWEKVVLNLLSNAFKFTLEGEIEVTLREKDGAAVLSVRDTGAGIAAEELPQIFERFHRVEGVRGRTHEGTGIGLALVQELVRLHQGSVGVASVYGQGSTFTVSIPFGTSHLPPNRIKNVPVAAGESLLPGPGALPYVEEALRWLPDKTAAPLPSGLPHASEASLADFVSARPAPDPEAPRPRVLLADDNSDMRNYVARLLSGRYEVEAVVDGDEALAATLQRPPDLVLADVMMPNRDGFGLLSALRADPATRTIPVVLLSARAGEEAEVEGLEAGADDYLVKPFSARELLARVGAHLEMARLRREAADREQTLRAEAGAAKERAAILESITDAFYALDREWRFTFLNRQCERYFNRSRDEILGRSVWEAFPMVIGSSFDTEYRRAVREQVQVDFEVLSPLSDRWVEVHAYPATDGGLAVYFRDITERKQAEETLRENEARQRGFIRDVLFSVSEGRLRLCEDAADLPPPLPAQGPAVTLTEKSVGVLRRRAAAAGRVVGLSGERIHDLQSALGEAGMNAVLHAGGGTGVVRGDADTVQVWIEDQGSGIAVHTLHRATLERGYTTAGTLGHGFWMMLKTADRVYLLTGAEGTTVVIEQDRVVPIPAWLARVPA